MKLYTQTQVLELLTTQRGNSYVAVLNVTKDKEIAGLASKAPLPGGDRFDEYYGIDAAKLINDDLMDKELQRNFDGFKKHRISAKTSYNACVPTLNSMIEKIISLKELIVTSAIQNIPTEDAVNRLAKLDEGFKKLSKKADELKADMNRYDTLIKNYEDWNDRKLFMHWKYLTLFKVTDDVWLDWKEKYKDTKGS